MLSQTMRRLFFTCTLLMPLAIGVASNATAAWPERTIHLVVPFTPGASNDVIARALSTPLSKALGQSVVVENRPGAGGAIGANYVATAAPDGYTLMLTTNAVASVSAVQKTPYDPGKDFDSIARIAQSPFVIVTRDGLPGKSLRGLVDYAKANPGKLNYGTTGVGDIIHLASALFAKNTGIEMTAVAYQGTGPAITDLVAGRIDLLFTSYPSVRGSAANRLPLVAVTSAERNAALPDIPTVRESGINYTMNIWWGVFAPRNIPRDAREQLNQAINRILDEPSFSALLKTLAANAPPISANDMQKLLVQDVADWRATAEAAGLRPR